MLQAIDRTSLALGRTSNQEAAGEWVRSGWKICAPWLQRLVPVMAIAGVFFLALWAMIEFKDAVSGLGNWGYLGVFLAESGSAAMVFIPTPAPAYTLTAGMFLNPFALGLIGGAGAALGELAGYYLGKKGSHVVRDGKLYRRFESFAARWTGAALFSFSLLPLPLDMAGLWAGSIRYPVWRFLAYIAPGKVIRVVLIAAAGHYGISWLAGIA